MHWRLPRDFGETAGKGHFQKWRKDPNSKRRHPRQPRTRTQANCLTNPIECAHQTRTLKALSLQLDQGRLQLWITGMTRPLPLPYRSGTCDKARGSGRVIPVIQSCKRPWSSWSDKALSVRVWCAHSIGFARQFACVLVRGCLGCRRLLLGCLRHFWKCPLPAVSPKSLGNLQCIDI